MGYRKNRIGVGVGAAGMVLRSGRRAVGRVFRAVKRRYSTSKGVAGLTPKRRLRRPRGIRGVVKRVIGGSISKYRSRIGKDKYMAKLSSKLGRQMYVGNASGRFSVAPGIQGVSTLTELLKGAQINTGTAVTTNGRVFLSRGRMECRFTNNGSNTIQVELYNITARRDQVNGSSYAPPDAAWVAGETAVSGGSSSAYQQIGNLPFDSPQFTDYYVVRKITRFLMGPGDVHTHYANFKMAKYCRQDVNANTQYQKGVYQALMVVASGMPECDSMTVQVTSGEVTLDWVSCTRVCFESVTNNVPTVHLGNTLPGSFTNAEEDMEVTGIPEAFTNT
jgi:hypothetical protein